MSGALAFHAALSVALPVIKQAMKEGSVHRHLRAQLELRES
jgi:hypothetical protein